jgi:hypothetical protein
MIEKTWGVFFNSTLPQAASPAATAHMTASSAAEAKRVTLTNTWWK